MNIQKIPRTTIDFAVSAKLKYSEKIRDIILPSCRNLFILLFLIGFIYSFYEEAKIQFILKASQGTHTELINHWLLRNYQSNLLISAKYASQYIFNVGIIVFLIVILAFTVFAFISNIFLRRMSSPTSFVQKLLIIFENKYFRKINANFLTIILVSLITLPIIIVFFKSKMRLSSDLYALIFPVVITCIAALSSTSFAILFGISARLGWKSRLKDFSNQSAIFLILLFILLLIPPICILISGFKWMSLIGYNSISIIYIVWIIGHTILSLPLLGSFILSVHFNVRNSELDYLKAHFIKQKDIFIWSFLKRFKLEYLLTFIISFSLIWNEALLNRIMSAKIHSFASSLEMLYIGRGADYSKALGYLIISILISASIIVIWKRISSKTIKFI